MDWFSTDPERLPLYAAQRREIDPGRHPVVAGINEVATWVADRVGPMLWAALIVCFLWAGALSN